MSINEPSQRGITPNGWHVDYDDKILNLKTNLVYIGLTLTEHQMQYLRSQFDMLEEHFGLREGKGDNDETTQTTP
jgi:hypothetical protein